MKNIPKKIYLQIAETKEGFDKLDFNDLKNVSWQKERVFKTDIKYILPQNWEMLKQKFYDECTDNYQEMMFFGSPELRPNFIVNPKDVFEWFKNNIK